MIANLFDIKRFAVHDGPGVRTTVFFKSCPLRCDWCHNPEALNHDFEEIEEVVILDGNAHSFIRHLGFEITISDLMAELQRDKNLYSISGGGVTFSGGEPLMQADALRQLITECRRQGIHTAIDTCGEIETDLLLELCKESDLILFDIKKIDSEEHEHKTGKANRRILENLGKLVEIHPDVRIRYPYIPGFNDSVEDLEQLANYLHSLQRIPSLELLPYHIGARSKYGRLRGMQWKGYRVPQADELCRAKDILKQNGIDEPLFED